MWGPLVARGHVGPGVGAGHVLRLLALAEAWMANGDRVTVIGPSPESPLAERVTATGAQVLPLIAGAGTEADAAALVRLAADDAAPWVVADGAPFGPEFQAAVAGAGTRLLVIDDHARHGRYGADLVLDQNLGASAARYDDRGSARVLLGPSYVLLRHEFTRATPHGDHRRVPRRLVIVLGGDPTDEVRSFGDDIADRLRRALPDLEVDFRVGGDDLRGPWAEHLAAADLAVAAAGTTSWELCHLGIPAVLVGVADDQLPVGAALGAAGAAAWAGPLRSAGVSQIVDAVVELAGDADLRIARSATARRLVDGRGASRVVAEMRAPLLHLRQAREDDAVTVWEWANDPVTRDSSFDRTPIPWEDHIRWFEGLLADPGRSLFLAVGPDGSPVGQVRFDRDAGDSEIGVTVAPGARGRGVAAPLILAGARRVSTEHATTTVHAHVRPENAASLAAFASAGFETVGTTKCKGPTSVHLRWEAADAR